MLNKSLSQLTKGHSDKIKNIPRKKKSRLVNLEQYHLKVSPKNTTKTKMRFSSDNFKGNENSEESEQTYNQNLKYRFIKGGGYVGKGPTYISSIKDIDKYDDTGRGKS